MRKSSEASLLKGERDTERRNGKKLWMRKIEEKERKKKNNNRKRGTKRERDVWRMDKMSKREREEDKWRLG